MNTSVTETHNAAVLGCVVKYCVLEQKTWKSVDPYTCKAKRVKLDHPRYFGVAVLAFGYTRDFPDVDDLDLANVNVLKPPMDLGKVTAVYGYSPSALRDGRPARRFFAKSVFDTADEMRDELRRLGVDPATQRWHGELEEVM